MSARTCPDRPCGGQADHVETRRLRRRTPLFRSVSDAARRKNPLRNFQKNKRFGKKGGARGRENNLFQKGVLPSPLILSQDRPFKGRFDLTL